MSRKWSFLNGSTLHWFLQFGSRFAVQDLVAADKQERCTRLLLGLKRPCRAPWIGQCSIAIILCSSCHRKGQLTFPAHINPTSTSRIVVTWPIHKSVSIFVTALMKASSDGPGWKWPSISGLVTFSLTIRIKFSSLQPSAQFPNTDGTSLQEMVPSKTSSCQLINLVWVRVYTYYLGNG